MPSKVSRSNTVYGYPNPQLSAFPDPIVAQRAPTTADKAVVGQIWVDQVGQLSYIFIKNSAGDSVWVVQSNNGGAAVFTSLTVNGASVLTGSVNQTAGNVSLGADAAAQSIALGTGAAAKTISIGSVTAGSTLALRATASVSVESDLEITTAGKKLIINGGAATDFIGTTTLVAGTVTIANTNIAANDRILLSRRTAGAGAVGFLTYVITPATNFVINSIDATGAAVGTDTGDIDYIIVRQI